MWLLKEQKLWKWPACLIKYPIQPRWLELGAVAWSNDNNLILLLGVIVLIHWTLRKKADDPLMVVKKRRKEEIDSYALELFWNGNHMFNTFLMFGFL